MIGTNKSDEVRRGYRFPAQPGLGHWHRRHLHRRGAAGIRNSARPGCPQKPDHQTRLFHRHRKRHRGHPYRGPLGHPHGLHLDDAGYQRHRRRKGKTRRATAHRLRPRP